MIRRLFNGFGNVFGAVTFHLVLGAPSSNFER